MRLQVQALTPTVDFTLGGSPKKKKIKGRFSSPTLQKMEREVNTIVVFLLTHEGIKRRVLEYRKCLE